MTVSNSGISSPLRVGAARHTKPGIIVFGRYRSGETAIQILDDDGDLQTTATVAVVPYGAPHPGECGVWLKGWSENEGIPNALAEAGIVILTHRTCDSDRVRAEHALLTDTALTVCVGDIVAQQTRRAERVYREIDELTSSHSFSPERALLLKASLTPTVVDACLGTGMSDRELIDLYDQLITAGPKSPGKPQSRQQG
jgi:hypothetical protein